MDVLNVDASLSDEEVDNDDGIQRLVQGLNISDLSSTGTEFGVHVNEDAALEMQTSYEGHPDLLPHLNLSCLGPEDDDNDDNNDVDTETESGSQTPFSFLASKMTDLISNGKVKKRILSEGYGEVVPESALVWFHYNSYHEGLDEPFDSSYLRGPLSMLRLNSGKCILGLDIGLSSMKRDEKAEFLIHPDYAYGSLGVPPRIPENAFILVRVELKKFVDNALALKMGELTEEELKTKPFEEIYKGARSLLFNGNNDFSQKRYHTAIKLYRNAVRILENCTMQSDDDDSKNEQLRLKLYSNLGVCYNKLNQPKQAIVQCQKALCIDPNGPKILYNLGFAHLNLSSFDEAKKFAFRARKYAPHNPDVGSLLHKIENKIQRYHSSTVLFARKAFNSEAKNTEKVNLKIDSSVKDKKNSVGTVPLENSKTMSSLTQSSGVKIVEIPEDVKKCSDEITINEEHRKVSLQRSEDSDEADHDIEFQRQIISCIEEFLADPTENEFPMLSGLTYEEEVFFITQAKMHGLRQEEREEHGRTQILFRK